MESYTTLDDFQYIFARDPRKKTKEKLLPDIQKSITNPIRSRQKKYEIQLGTIENENHLVVDSIALYHIVRLLT